MSSSTAIILLLLSLSAGSLGFAPSSRFGVIRQTSLSRFEAPLLSEVNDVAEGAAEAGAVEETADVSMPEVETPAEESTEDTADENEAEEVKPERFTMFVGNVPFETTDSELRDMFAEYGTVELVSVPRQRETGMARGFAFIDMSSKEEVERAIDGMNGVMVGGRAIRVVESQPKEERTNLPPKPDDGAQKIYVGNIPFDATRDELMDFYSEYGEVKEVYIPLDVSSGQQRGFAFVTMKAEDAETAIEQTNGAEFSGRTLTVSKPLPRGEKAPQRASGPPRTKLYVGNLSFYTELDTVKSMFEEYGKVIDCYMPEDRETGGSRGFAFVTMGQEDALTAMDETDGYELDGRIIRVNEAQPKGREPPVRDEEEGDEW